MNQRLPSLTETTGSPLCETMASQIVRRADAARNIDRILESAIHGSALDPGAGMNEVAEHAGVGRATLYRHFPSRDDLMAAIKAQARQEAVAAVESCPLEEGSSLESIEQIVSAVIVLWRPLPLHQRLALRGRREPRAHRAHLRRPASGGGARPATRGDHPQRAPNGR